MTSIREVHKARVVDNNDEEKRGRLLLASASLLGIDEAGQPVEYPDWVEPTFPVLTTGQDGKVNGGMFFVPGIGSTVELEVTGGSAYDQVPGQSAITNPDPRWRAQLLQRGDELHEDFKKNYPNRSGWITGSGHGLVFDDSDGDQNTITVKHSSGSFISLDGDGSVVLAVNKEGDENKSKNMLVYLNAKKGEFSITCRKNIISISETDGVKILGANGTTFVAISPTGEVSIRTGAQVGIQGGSIVLTAPKVQVGGPASVLPALRGPTLAAEVLADFALIAADLAAIGIGAGVPATYTPNAAVGAAALSPTVTVT